MDTPPLPQELSDSVMQAHSRARESKESGFSFRGEEGGFVGRVAAMSEEEIQEMTACDVCIVGEQVKPDNPKCFILTILLGLCLLFPLLFFCCQWWKRAVSQVTRIKEQTYSALARILRAKKMQEACIRVYDNYLNKAKIRLLLRAMAGSRILRVTLINEAGAFDMNDNEYSDFLRNIKPLLQLGVRQWRVGWYKQSMESEQLTA